jgi:hypothetical protein
VRARASCTSSYGEKSESMNADAPERETDVMSLSVTEWEGLILGYRGGVEGERGEEEDRLSLRVFPLLCGIPRRSGRGDRTLQPGRSRHHYCRPGQMSSSACLASCALSLAL